MPNPHSLSFCAGYAVCLAVVSVAALHCIRRFRYPLVSFVLGLAAVIGIFGFSLWLESGLVSAGEADYQMGEPYRFFLRAVFAVILVFFLVRSGYLIRHVFSRRSSSAA